MKKSSILVGLLASVLVLSACGEIEDKPTQEELTTPIEEVEEVEAEVVEEEVVAEPEKIEVVEKIVEYEGAVLTYTGFEYSEDLDLYQLSFEMVNNSDKMISIHADQVSVDNIMNDPFYGTGDIPAGKADVGAMQFYDVEIKPGTVVDGVMIVSDAEAWETLEEVPFSITVQ